MLAQNLESLVKISTKRKNRFVVFYKENIISIKLTDIAYFSIEDGTMYLLTFDGKKYPLKKSMKDLEEAVDDYLFFKANRSALISFDSIDRVETFFGQRVVVFLKPGGRVIVSKSKLTAFLSWLDI